MSSPISSSEREPSSAFELLAEPVRRWIWERGWVGLREVQERAIPLLLEGDHDVIISAATASGKTEAAFFPICSRLLDEPGDPGIGAVCVSPLKALINDQFQRLDEFCERLGISITRWHGDVPEAHKRRAFAEPNGLLLITPESLEALFVVHGLRIKRIFGGLRYMVIDELHSFIGSERGRQLQSLLHRVETSIGRTVPRVGLSATLADMSSAAAFLRPGAGEKVSLVEVSGGQDLLLQIRGYLAGALKVSASEENEQAIRDAFPIATDIFKSLRGSKNLIFANSRARVEVYADLLRRISEREKVPNEFWPHHGSLARGLREDVEEMLKTLDRSVSAVCTSTLEMGIDIGNMKAVAQIGAPPSVAGLRQRLGRSGRREGEAAILRIYVSETPLDPRTSIQDRLRPELVQSIAMVRLLLRRWCEPPYLRSLHLSTLVQQVLSLIAQAGGASASDAWRVLCRTGPFNGVDQALFARLLRCLARHDFVQQSADGTLLLGIVGERIVNHYSFFAAFVSAEEYRIVEGGHDLGSMPLQSALAEGMFIIFAGRRWRVLSVDPAKRVVEVAKTEAGRPPRFSGLGGVVHDVVRREMRTVLIEEDFIAYPYLDAEARDLLGQARAEFRRLGLHQSGIVSDGRDTLLFPWVGDLAVDTLALRLVDRGFVAGRDSVAVVIQGVRAGEVVAVLRDLETVDASPEHLAALARNRLREKYDSILDDELLAIEHASRAIDVPGSTAAIRELLGGIGAACARHT